MPTKRAAATVEAAGAPRAQHPREADPPVVDVDGMRDDDGGGGASTSTFDARCVDGVGAFGMLRFARSKNVVSWTCAGDDVMLKFWIIMNVLTLGQMRTLIALMKAGRHRMAADGLRSYEIALFTIVAMLVQFGLSDGHDAAESLYIFIHHYIHHHLTDAERELFFGDGSCAFGATFNKAIEDKMGKGMSTYESWKANIIHIRERYVAGAAVMEELGASGPHTLTVKVTGGLQEMQNVPESEREITMTIDGPFVPHECDTTKMFLSNLLKKVYHEACPPSIVETELRRDWRVTKCAISGNRHVQSDTFYGLRIEFIILSSRALRVLLAKQAQCATKQSAAYSVVSPPDSLVLRSQKSWRKMLRKEARALRKEAMESFPTTSALLCASMSYVS